MLVIVLGTAILLSGCTISSSSPKSGLLAVALAVNPGMPVSLRGYIGDPARQPFSLPSGAYYVEVLDGDGRVLSLGKVTVPADGTLRLPSSLAQAGGTKDAARATQLRTIVGFLVRADLTSLTALSGASADFKTALFAAKAKTTQAQLDRLYKRYREVSSQRESVLAAIDALDDRARVSVPTYVAGLNWAPAPGVFGKIKDKLLGFFGYAGDAGQRARERILKIAQRLNPEDQEDAFAGLRPSFRG
ncbi:MAG: hypothetical protein ACYC7H_08115, partial [Chloroflexota bacterium]